MEAYHGLDADSVLVAGEDASSPWAAAGGDAAQTAPLGLRELTQATRAWIGSRF
jgi:hypothetical protein